MNLRGKTIIVTGAGSGIGRALALDLAGRGAKLSLNDVSEAALAETASMLGTEVETQAFSVADRGEWEGFAARTVSRFGALDGIVNNAGIGHEAVATQSLSVEHFQRVMDVNFWGVVHGTQVALPHLRASPQAFVANVSSVYGLVSVALLNAYCTSKFAVRGFTESLRMEAHAYFPHVTIHSIHPGGIATNVAKSGIDVGSRTREEADRDREAFEKGLKTSPERAAAVIRQGLEKGRERILIGMDAKIADGMGRLRPVGYTDTILGDMRRNGIVIDDLPVPLTER